ncbi:type 1 glutamine amidotransferase domain-containing protein [Georgenia sp. AZ-5]|uniref:type 1 glutamine amidotransferase domain-containing protein n=1 Tax=Georgenia sp. AZ-5 TaxID=3367526 RepID=UPI003754C8DD
MADLSGKKVAFITSQKGVEDAELTGPWQALRDAGASTMLLAPEQGEVATVNNDDEPADSYPVDQAIGDADADEFDAVVIPGGTINADTLRQDHDAVAFVTEIAGAGKPVAAICHGPWLLVEAGLAKGRRTSYPSLSTDLTNAGAEWVDEEVVVDHTGETTVITSRNPQDVPAFSEAVIDALS